MPILVIGFSILIFIGAIVAAFFFGRMITLQRAATQTSQISFAASIWALTEAKALKDGVIIQRTIEKMHVVEKKDEEQLTAEAKAMTEAMEAAVDGLNVKRNKIEPRFDPKDLV